MSNLVLFILYGVAFLTITAFPLLMCYGKSEILHMVLVVVGSVFFQAPLVWDLFDGNTLRGIIILVLYVFWFIGFNAFISRIYFKGLRNKKPEPSIEFKILCASIESKLEILRESKNV